MEIANSLMQASSHRRTNVERGVLVIGAGVSGLTSALCLARHGFTVTIIADQFAPKVTSVVAGALWEWPPAVCGHHYDEVAVARSKVWCSLSYEIFAELSREPSTGVFLRPANFYFKRTITQDPRQREKMDELSKKVRHFKHDPALIAETAINPALGFCDAYSYLAPMIDTDVYLGWLLNECKQAGCRIVEHKILGRLRDQEKSLLHAYSASIIVNCSGLGARILVDDRLYPLRGALIRLRNDGTAMPRITQAYCVSNEGFDQDRGFIFVVPRGNDTVVLGGLAEPHEWELNVGLHNYEPIREIYRRCVEFLPSLREGEFDQAEPVRVGLRPFHPQNVRLEEESGTNIVHNYGHGGSGVTLSWGCALEIARRVVERVDASESRSMPASQSS